MAHGSRQLPYSNHAGKGLTYYALSYSSIKLYVPYHALMVALVSNHERVSSSGNAKRNELIFEQKTKVRGYFGFEICVLIYVLFKLEGTFQASQ